MPQTKMVKRLGLTFAAACAFALSAGSAYAQNLNNLDQDADGAINAQELMNLVKAVDPSLAISLSEAQMLIQLGDANGNGKLEGAEIQNIANIPGLSYQPGQDMAVQAFNTADQNGDQRVSWGEMQMLAKNFPGLSSGHMREARDEFTRADLNRDGSLNMAEFKKMMR